jgi:hypothetical protein
MAKGCVRLQLSRSEMQAKNTSPHLLRASKIIRREIVNLLNRGGPLGAEFMLR